MRISVQSCELLIDGAKVPPREVWTLYQRDPFPGFGRYRLTLALIPAPIAVKRWRLMRLGHDEWIVPRQDEASSLLNEIALLLRYCDDAEPKQYRYFLNSITRLQRIESTIIVEGVCSPTASSGT